MTVLITLTTAGTDTGPFNLYSNVDGYVSAFETGVSKAALLAGYSSALVPNGTTIIRIKSTGTCVNYIDVSVVTTTTTTTTGTPTTTTTTSAPPTTTTTTTEGVGGQLFVYAKYINSSDELGYTVNGGPYLGIGTVPTTDCDYLAVINGCNNGDNFVFTTLLNRAISGATSSPCPASAGSCTYNYTFTGTGSNFVYITIDGSVSC